MINPQTKVGLLIIAVIGTVMGVIINLGEVRLKSGYKFYVLFDDLADLPARSVVKIAGVDVGRVNKVELYQGRARVGIWVEKSVKIHKDTKVKISKMGMLGNTYISLSRGTEKYPLLQSGDTVEGINPLSYEEVIDGFVSGLNKVVQVFQKINGKENLGKDIGQTFANLKELTGSLNSVLGKNGGKLGKAIDNINSVLSNLNVILEKEVTVVSVSIEKLGNAADELRVILEDIRLGKGVIGKILTSEEYGRKIGETVDSIYSASKDLKQAVNRFKGFDTSLEAEVYYEPENEVYRSYMGLTFRTSSRRYLNFGIENIKADEEGIDTGGDRINAITFKAGKSFGSFTVFGGVIRSSGGLGADWVWEDRLRIETKLFEFTRAKPWWTVSSKLRLTEFLNLGLAYEDILKKGRFRAGVEVKIE